MITHTHLAYSHTRPHPHSLSRSPHKAEDQDKTSSGLTYYDPHSHTYVGDHWGATKPSSRALSPGDPENLKRLYGSEWKHTVRESYGNDCCYE
ncbi:MAG: hypothetical protein ACPIOQ_01985 [Promethearchaeia archaeon]